MNLLASTRISYVPTQELLASVATIPEPSSIVLPAKPTKRDQAKGSPKSDDCWEVDLRPRFKVRLGTEGTG
jgi:hypothetical protein